MNLFLFNVFLIFMLINISFQASDQDEKVYNLLKYDQNEGSNTLNLRRNLLEEELNLTLTWLTHDQIEVLHDLKEIGKNASELEEEVWSFYSILNGVKRMVAAKRIFQYWNSSSEEELSDIKQMIRMDSDTIREIFQQNNETELIAEYFLIHCIPLFTEFYKELENWRAEKKILSALKELCNLNETCDTFEKLYQKSKLLIKLLQFEDAIKIYNTMLEFEPNATNIIEQKADALVILEKYDEGIKLYDRILKMDPENLMIITKKVNALIKHSDQSYEKAVEIIFEKYLQHHIKWLDESQKRQIRRLKAEGKKSPKIFAKIVKFYENLQDNELKNEALHSMENGCIHFLYSVFGNKNAEKLLAIKENSSEIFEQKYNDFFENLIDEGQKRIGAEYMSTCRKILTFNEEQPPRIIISPKINGKTLEFIFDSGAFATMADREVWEEIGQPYLHPFNKIINGIGGFKKEVLGRCRVEIEFDGKKKREWLIIVEDGFRLFGRNWVKTLNLKILH